MLDKLKSYFAAKPDVTMAFLFGSRAKGRDIGESDVDVAVWLAEPSFATARRIWGELEDLLKRDVDLVVLNDAAAATAWEAIRGTRLVVRDEQLFIDRMLEVSAEAEDFAEWVEDFWRWRRLLRKGA